MPVVQDKFDGGERKAMADMFVPGFQALARDYGVEQFQFHTPPAVSWLRVHAPQKYGDDLSSLRSTVVAANRTLQPVRGLEGGVAGLGIRGMVPVQRAGRHVGSVEFGMGFGQPFFDQFKQQNGVDVALHVMDKDGSFKAMASTFGKELMPDAAGCSARSAARRSSTTAMPRAGRSPSIPRRSRTFPASPSV